MSAQAGAKFSLSLEFSKFSQQHFVFGQYRTMFFIFVVVVVLINNSIDIFRVKVCKQSEETRNSYIRTYYLHPAGKSSIDLLPYDHVFGKSTKDFC